MFVPQEQAWKFSEMDGMLWDMSSLREALFRHGAVHFGFMDLHAERLNWVHPLVAAKVRIWQQMVMDRLRMPLLIVSGWRAVMEQADRYQLGRHFNPDTKQWEILDPTQIVTKAKPGLSAHNTVDVETGHGAAVGVDVIPIDTSGQPLWRLPNESPATLGQRWMATFHRPEQVIWDELYMLAHRVGLDPLGDRVGAYLPGDKGHFEEGGWRYVMPELGIRYPFEMASMDNASPKT